ncbi:MAG: AAA family ATPase, partial [Chloroflexota bacterium]|nr:AAA family ATPase [Chloroflexota bacterium]
MIRSVCIRGFKRFREVEFRLPGHVVLAGPNNTGKTTLLQAIASWTFALRRWRELNDFNRRNGYRRVPLARQAFAAVPLRSFDLLWTDRHYQGQIEIELRHDAGWAVTMEFIADSTEQIYVRPAQDSSGNLRDIDLQAVFVPPMTGIGINEPLFYRPKIEQLLGLGRPGEVLRNLLAEANRDQAAWEALQAAIDKLFGYRLRPPDTSAADILAEYETTDQGVPFDIASAGSGFHQVLMLLALLNTRHGAVVLLDEPDAHLHMILQDAIYHELRSTAARHGSQLIVATHSEVVINSVEPRELVVTLSQPRLVADNDERSRLISSLRVLSNADVTQALDVRGILYVEDYTDINILRAWAETLQHRASGLLTTELMWKPTAFHTQEGRPGRGVTAREHFAALQLVRDDLPALELLDGDARREIGATPITGSGLQRLRWRRYEIESYLLHPEALARFVEAQVGTSVAREHIDGLLTWWRRELPPAVVDDPLGEHPFLNGTKARTDLLPPLLQAAEIFGLPYTRYHEIAALMRRG